MKKNGKVINWLWQNSKGSKLAILLLMVLCVIYSLIQLEFVTASKNLIDLATGVIEGSFLDGFIVLIVLLLLLLALQIIIDFMNIHALSKFEIALKTRIFKSMIGKDYLAITGYHSGDLINRLSSDVNIISYGIVEILPTAALLFTSLIGAMIMLWQIDPLLSVIILAIAPFVAIGTKFYSPKYKALHKKCQSAEGDTKSFMLEMLQNILVVKSFSGEKAALKRAEKLQNRTYKLRLSRAALSIVASVGLFLVFNAGYYFALAYGAYSIAVGVLTFGELTAILQLVDRIQAPFKNISGLIPQAVSVIASTERLLEIEDIKNETSTGKNVLSDFDEIRFNNVTFKYSDDAVVSNIDMSIKKGEFAVISGESGVGKSTTLKLLLGLLEPESGEISVVKDCKQYRAGYDTRNLFAYVPQGNMIFSGTVRDNICFARENATDAEIEHAAKIAQIWGFISSLDDGLDTVIGEHGVGVSEGQAQRISIARAILYDAPVLLLDESTSALDSDTEAALLNALRTMTDKTCIIVSHRKAAFEVCDKVCAITKSMGGNISNGEV